MAALGLPPSPRGRPGYGGPGATLEVTSWTDHLAALEAAGWKRWGAADFRPGDTVLTRFGVRDVIRVTRESLSVTTPYSWTETLPYGNEDGLLAPDAVTVPVEAVRIGWY